MDNAADQINSMRLMSFDPGGTTGWCLHQHVGAGEPVPPGPRWVGGQLTGGEVGHHLELWELLKKYEPTVIIYEAFNYQIRQRQAATMPGVQLISREYIGILQLWARLYKIPIVKQQPSVIGIQWVKDPALKKFGLYNVGEPHRNDAARHMVYFIVSALESPEMLRALRN